MNGSEASNCCLLLKQVQESVKKEANNELRKQGLTSSQAQMLMALYEADQHCLSLKQMEKSFQVSQPTIVGIVKRLEQKGYVESHNFAGDKRVKIVAITEDGIAKLSEGKAAMDKVQNRWFQGLSEEEQTQFRTILEKIALQRDNF